MSTTNQISTMAVIQPLSDGIIAMAVMSAMASIMATATSVSAMGAAGAAGGMGAFAGSSNPYEELGNLNKRISRLNYLLGNQKEAVRGTREHKAELMKEYGLGVLPSVVEMKKYPKLRMTDYYLRKAEKDLDRMEVSMLNLQKRRKELQVKLGMRVDEEEGVRRVYPATKKFIVPIRREF